MSATQHFLVTIEDAKGEKAIFWVNSGSAENAGKRARALHGRAGEVVDCRTSSEAAKAFNLNSHLACTAKSD